MIPSFPMNAWYAAAWDVDIKHALFPRTICGKHIVVYRQADGQVTALEDACWHRGPLCAQYLGDLGADIIKVETVGQGDETRGWCRFRRGGSKAIAWCAAITA